MLLLDQTDDLLLSNGKWSRIWCSEIHLQVSQSDKSSAIQNRIGITEDLEATNEDFLASRGACDQDISLCGVYRLLKQRTCCENGFPPFNYCARLMTDT